MTKTIQPSSVNPLIVACGSEAVLDTIHQVNNVLLFLAASAEAIESNRDALQADGAASGLALVLLTCRAALDFHVTEGDEHV